MCLHILYLRASARHAKHDGCTIGLYCISQTFVLNVRPRLVAEERIAIFLLLQQAAWFGQRGAATGGF